MTTIGYGDFTPRTEIGVGIAMVLSFMGIIILSLLVASLRDFFAMRYSIYFCYLRREKGIDFT